jgi:hypothetical protein
MYLFSVFLLALTVPLLPVLVNGAPFNPDSWIHLRIAKEVADSGRYNLAGYNERWPLVNILLSFLGMVAEIPFPYTGYAVTLLVGLGTIPLFCFCRRLRLSKGAASTSIIFLSFNPLYSYITFASAIMKETSAYYLLLAMLLTSILLLKVQHTRAPVATLLIIGLGLILGHHYASLVALLFLWGLLGYTALEGVERKVKGFGRVLTAVVGFSIGLALWTSYNYAILSAAIPIFNMGDAMLLLVAFTVIWVSSLRDRGSLLSSKLPWFSLIAFAISVAGQRGLVYLLSQPQDPISAWEYTNYIVTGAFALSGIALGSRHTILKAFAASALSLVVFAFTWGNTYPGFVMLIKSLHYFGILLAIGAGFAATTLLRRGAVGKFVAAALILFTVHASSAGTEMALGGLSAYYDEELRAISSIPLPTSGVEVFADRRASTLIFYCRGINPSGIKPLEWPAPNTLIILLRPNMQQSFLFGYDWMPAESVLPTSKAYRWNRIFDGTYLRLLQW